MKCPECGIENCFLPMERCKPGEVQCTNCYGSPVQVDWQQVCDQWPVRTKRKIRFRDLLDPHAPWYSWQNIGGAQTALGLFAWMVDTGREFTKYRQAGPYEKLSKASCIGLDSVSPLAADWGQDLWMRFHYVLLDELDYHSGSVYEWRTKHRISIYETRMVPIQYRGSTDPANTGEIPLAWMVIDQLFTAGTTFLVSPNQCHPSATQIRRILLHCRAGYRWSVEVRYGIPEDASEWGWWIDDNEAEVLLDFVGRAAAAIRAETVPGGREQSCHSRGNRVSTR